MQRKIYTELLEWKNSNKNVKPLMLFGVRQCGKTYVIEEFCQKEFTNYIEVNLFEQSDVVNLYKSDLTSDEKFIQFKALLNFDFEKEDSVIFIDEIQKSEELIAELKYFCEKHNNVRIICAGSLLGVKLKRLKTSFPVGKVKMINMYPMDFEEFLMAMNENLLIDVIKDAYQHNKSIATPLHEKALNLYKTYLITGGMPESIQNMINADCDYIKYDKNILNNIIDAYLKDMNKYVSNDNETLKIIRLYNSLPSQLANASGKFQYSKIDKNARARDYETSLDWLEASWLVIKSKSIKAPNIPIEGFVNEEEFKLYLSDVGILNNKLKITMQNILTDNISLYKGTIAENYVANQLVAMGYDLYYWKNNNTAELDFVLNTIDGIIPVEVKAGNNTKAKSLNIYINEYNPKYSIRISTKEFGYDPNMKIKSIPLYAIFCLQDKKI